MRSRICTLALAAWLHVVAAHGVLHAQAAGITEDEYASRRQALLGVLDSASAALFHASDVRTRSNDTGYPFRQESAFLYLTGINRPGAALLIVPRGAEMNGAMENILLFVPPGGDRRAIRDGRVLPAAQLPSLLGRLAPQLQTLYASSLDPSAVRDFLNDRALFIDRDARREFQQRFKGLRVKSAAPLLTPFREVKSAAERELIAEAIRLTAEGVLRAMRACRPGMYEYELQAEIEYPMIRGGARTTAFPSIVGSGPNSLILHYEENRRRMAEGDVVVMDVGAEFAGYAADVTRTIPVSGRFNEPQAKVYDAVLRAADSVIAMIRPGVPLRMLEDRQRQVLRDAGFGAYMVHGVSHQLGLDAHDPFVSDTLRAGMVLTVEPGVYVPQGDTLAAPAFRGWGVRVEDDVLVTPDGREVLTRAIPRRREEVEATMRTAMNE